MQQDGIHPTAQGNDIVAKTVMRYLKPCCVSGKAEEAKTGLLTRTAHCRRLVESDRYRAATVRESVARRRCRSSAVAARWHFRHKVRMFWRSHSPPPSTTGTI